jgi:acyl-CoA thioesterase YciA
MNKDFNKAGKRCLSGKVIPMPRDTITERLISAGWLLSQMDVTAGNRAYKYAGGRAVTVALEAMEFKAPVFIGDDVEIYTEIIRQGRTSVAIRVEAFAETRTGRKPRKVTEGIFTFVHIDDHGRPKEIDPANDPQPKKEAKSQDKNQDKKQKLAAKGSEAGDVRQSEPPLKKGQELSLRTVPFPKNKNYNGDIFGGWVLEQMDIAGLTRARKHVGGAVAPVAIEAMTFHRPVSVLDEVSFYTEIVKIGNSSITVKIESWSLREDLKRYEKVTEGIFTYVAIDKDRKPIPIAPK